MNNTFTESFVDKAVLAWMESVGWQVRNGAEIALGELRVKNAERAIKETTA